MSIFCGKNDRWLVVSKNKVPVPRSFNKFFVGSLKKLLHNSRVFGDLRRQGAHVMLLYCIVGVIFYLYFCFFVSLVKATRVC